MKKILNLMTALIALTSGMTVSAAQFKDGNIVVYRVGTGTTLTNQGMAVFLDEFQPDGTPVQSFMLRTNYFGAYSPLIGSGTAFGTGLITLSKDGRFILVPGYGATLGTFTNGSIQGNFASSLPRVAGLVDGQGNTDTTTVETNSARDNAELRAAVSDDGTNIWTSGDAGGIRFLTRGSVSSVAVEPDFNFQNNVRQLQIFNNQLYFDINNPNGQTNSFFICSNNVAGTLPVATNNVTNAVLRAIAAKSPEAFFMTKLKAGGADPIDTLYVADGIDNEVAKYTYASGTWQRNGSIPGITLAVGLAGKIRIVGTTTNVDLFVSQGGTTLTGGNNIAHATDTTGYNQAPDGGDLALIVSGTGNKTYRGIVMAPTTNSDLALPSGAGRLSVGPAIDVFAKASTGCLNTNETDVYSLGNPGTSSINWTATVSTAWVSLTSSNGALASTGSTDVTVKLGDITGLTAATNTATITFSNTTSAVGTTTRAVTLYLLPQEVTPASDYTVSGQPGGPFTPSNKVYTVLNGSTPITLIVTQSSSRVNLSATTIALGACSSTIITASINQAVASNLTAGNYGDVITFSNATGNTVIDTRAVNLTVGGLFFCDDFSTFTQNADLEGQQGWVASTGNPTLKVTNNAAYDQASTDAVDEPYKNIPLTSNNVPFVYAAMVMTVTSAPPVSTASPSRGPIFWTTQNGGGFARDWISMRDTGGNTNFVFCIRKNAAGNAYVFGTTYLNYGTTYKVILQTDPGTDLYMALYVNPASACLATNTAYAVANNGGAIDPNVGSFSLQSQFANGASPASPGYAVYKVCITTNCTDAFNDVQTFGPPANAYTTWTSFYGLSGGSAGGGADPDGDGMSNTNEFLAGFNPTNSASSLHIISIVNTGINAKVTYLGANGDSAGSAGPKTNVLEFTTGTANSSYTNGNWVSTGSGATNTLTGGTGLGVVTNSVDVGGATNTPARYYRVRVLVP